MNENQSQRVTTVQNTPPLAPASCLNGPNLILYFLFSLTHIYTPKKINKGGHFCIKEKINWGAGGDICGMGLATGGGRVLFTFLLV